MNFDNSIDAGIIAEQSWPGDIDFLILDDTRWQDENSTLRACMILSQLNAPCWLQALPEWILSGRQVNHSPGVTSITDCGRFLWQS